VLNRHEELDPGEVARVLRPGGRLVTQQVGHDDWAELWRFFPERTDFGDLYAAYVDGLRAAGLSVIAAKHYRRVAYRTLGDLAYMLLLAPWLLPEFDPERDVDRLMAVEDALGTVEGIVVTESRYLVLADKGR
jgi:SAM-dependent methyltransferase